MRDDDSTLADHFAGLAKAARHDGGATYARICEAAADDPRLLALLAEAPADQRRPNLLLAAVHYLLLRGADHPLARYYPTVQDYRAGHGAARSEGAGGADPYPPFVDFALAHHDEIEVLLATRATQTNEVGRCSVLLPALACAEAGSGAPLGLLDLGASAGLNLLFDRYHYTYSGGPEVGPATSPVTLSCELRHGSLDGLTFPDVPHRAGLDLRPADPGNDDEVLWLLACQWPDDVPRFRRLAHALDLARRDPDRPAVRRGDMVDDLAALADAVPPGLRLCLVHSWVAAYLTPDRQAELDEAVGALSRRRPVTWIFAESAYEVPGLTVPPPPPAAGAGPKGATALVMITIEGGRRRAVRLGDAHPHGAWLHWWGDPLD